jgi:replicative DNA helicase
MSTQERYTFSAEYQRKLLALMLRDNVLDLYPGLIRPDYFTSAAMRDCAAAMIDYHAAYNLLPTFDAVSALLADTGAKADPAVALLSELSGLTVAEAPHIIDTVVSFTRHVAYAQARKASLDDLKEGKYQDIHQRMRDAEQVGRNVRDAGIDYWNDLSRLTWSRSGDTVGTGIPKLDDCLGGGLAAGELGVVLAGTGKFKTGTLVNFAVGALKQGVDVVFLSHEVKERVLAHRFDKCLFMADGVEYSKLADTVRERIEEYRRSIFGRLYIKRWSPDTATVDDMRAYLYHLQATERCSFRRRRTLLIVDYGQKMKPLRRYGEKRHEMIDNYRQLISLGEEFDCGVWSAAQATRASSDKDVLDVTDMSEAYAVCADADIILTLTAKKDEERRGSMRFYLAKVREAMGFRTITVNVDKERMQITSPCEAPAPQKSKLFPGQEAHASGAVRVK